MTESLQFFYNSGLPQRQRRARDNRPNAVNRDVPSFLVFPDGTHSLGVISPAQNSTGNGAGAEESDPLSQDSAVSGSFVVWADPAPHAVRREAWKYPTLCFYGIFLADLILVVLVLADNITAGRKGDFHLATPPLELPVLSFTVGIVVKFVGLWGVYKEQIRYLSVFIAVTLFLTILSFMWIGELKHLAIIALDVILILAAYGVRSSLSGRWFSARISGAGR